MQINFEKINKIMFNLTSNQVKDKYIIYTQTIIYNFHF